MGFLFVLISGMIIGWALEFFYKLFDQGKIIFPKFINVQMYIYTSLFSYLLFSYDFSVIFVIFSLFVFTSGIEFIIGYLCLKIRGYIPWDYLKYRLNYRGIICLKFSFYWLIIAFIYYYLILPSIVSLSF